MAPSASKQKRLAEKAAKASASGKSTGANTPAELASAPESTNGDSVNSAASAMAKLSTATDRYVNSDFSGASACYRD